MNVSYHQSMESMVQRQAREVLDRLLRWDIPPSLDTYPDLKRQFEVITGCGWAEYLLTRNHPSLETVLRHICDWGAG
jgi:hypothetical protein